MRPFHFKVPQTIEFGVGSLKKLSEILNENHSDKVFLISDCGIAQVGLVDRVTSILEEHKIPYSTFVEVRPNPTIEVVENAFLQFKESGASSLIALGGGGPLDVAKAIGVLASHGGDIRSYEGLNKVPGPIIPLIAIPTTAGTGSEVTASSVVTDTERNYKFSIISYEILPRYAILDPELIMTAPASIAASCGVDALIHAMEAYVSRFANPYTDAMAEKAMSLIGRHIRHFVADRTNEDAACAMMLGSTFAGMSFAWAKLGAIHSMSHPISAYFHVPHGVANAALMPTIAAFNAIADMGKYKKIHQYIFPQEEMPDFRSSDLSVALFDLNEEIGLPTSLRQLGVTKDKFEAMSEDAMKSPNTLANPRQLSKKDFISLYEKAY